MNENKDDQTFVAAMSVIDEDFRQYLDLIQPALSNFIGDEQKKIEHLIALIESYYLFTTYLGDTKAIKNTHRIVGSLLVKAVTDFAAIGRCIEFGFPLQSRTLLRSLLETAITTSFIFMDFSVRANLYAAYEYVAKYYAMKRDPDLIRTPVERKYIKEKYNEIKDKYEPYKDWYYRLLQTLIDERYSGKQNKPKPSLRTLADSCGMKKDYDHLYSTLSLASHPSVVPDHLFRQVSGGFNPAPQFEECLVATVTGMAFGLVHKVVATILNSEGTIQTRRLVSFSEILVHQALEVCKSSVGSLEVHRS
jgi:hypothetical protein